MEPTDSNAQSELTPHKPGKFNRLRQMKTKIAFIIAVVALIVLSAVVILLTKDKLPTTTKAENQINQTVQSNLGRIDGIDIKFDPITGTASIIQTEETEIPEISAQNVRTAYILLVRLGDQVFDEKDVNNIQVVEKVRLNFPVDPANEFLPEDQRATRPPVVTDVVTIAMSKFNFQSVNWQEQSGNSIHKLITEKAHIYNINSELKPQLHENELYLDL
jgi:hypothetical protein